MDKKEALEIVKKNSVSLKGVSINFKIVKF